MKHHILLLSSLLLAPGLSAYATQESFHALPVRNGTQQAFWLIEPDHPTHIVILFAGGSGKLKISGDGIGKDGNFLVRSRNLFADQGMATVIVDKPDDRKDLYLFRKTNEHAQDVQAVMDFMRKRIPGKPLWLVGTSRGTISVANAAARINGAATPDGIVLTSAVTSKSKRGLDSLEDIELTKITVPTLIVHHVNDECSVTRYDDAERLLQSLTSVTVKVFRKFSGGTNDGNPCKGLSYHGFSGIEPQVIGSIVEWIKAH